MEDKVTLEEIDEENLAILSEGFAVEDILYTDCMMDLDDKDFSKLLQVVVEEALLRTECAKSRKSYMEIFNSAYSDVVSHMEIEQVIQNHEESCNINDKETLHYLKIWYSKQQEVGGRFHYLIED